jgi:hypothetical protein
MPQILLTGQLKEKPTSRVLCLYSLFVHGTVPLRFTALDDASLDEIESALPHPLPQTHSTPRN